MQRLFVFALAFVMLVAAHATTASSSRDARGVAADGHVVIGRYGASPPWAADIVRFVKPDYPASLRAQHPIGIGWFRLLLDLKTGRVRQVVVEKPSGYRAIDNSIIAALQQWRLRPNRWREFNVELQLGFGNPPPGPVKASN